MTTLDMVARVGGKPANFLDIGGGAKAEIMYKALTFVARDPDVKGILVNIFGGITRGEEVARGVIMAQAELPKGMPVVVRLSGTGAEEGRAMLKDAGLEWGKDMRDAAEKMLIPYDERIRLTDPCGVARSWADAGFRRLHVVDLDAAMGRGSNERIVRDIIGLDGLSVQVGGGVRSDVALRRLHQRCHSRAGRSRPVRYQYM